MTSDRGAESDSGNTYPGNLRLGVGSGEDEKKEKATEKADETIFHQRAKTVYKIRHGHCFLYKAWTYRIQNRISRRDLQPAVH